MRDEVWYREELRVLHGLVEQAIAATEITNRDRMTLLGWLHRKLEIAISNAPSAHTSEGTT